MDFSTVFTKMASVPKYPKLAEDFSPSVKISEVLDAIKDLYFGAGPVNIDEKFLDELKSVLESKIVPANSDIGSSEIFGGHPVMKKSSDGTGSKVLLPDISKSEWELANEEGLPLPNEMLTEIFSYLDFQEISRCAQVSQQFNNISELTWKSWDKITILGKEVPSEFLTFLLEKGIKELRILECKLLPPKPPKLTHPLKLKSVYIRGECIFGYDGLMTNVLKTHPMERIELDYSEKFISGEKFSEFIASLPQTGSQLKSLSLPDNFELNRESLGYIVESCVNLEELGMPYCDLLDSDLDYLSDNLTPSILKLDLFGNTNYNDKALCKLVKRCSKLQTLDIGGTKVTWYGLSAIIDNLPCLECLALPLKIREELGLENEIDMLKMEKLCSMKQLKCLVIVSDSGCTNLKYHEMLAKEMPQLIRPEFDYSNVARIDDSGHKQVEFLEDY